MAFSLSVEVIIPITKSYRGYHEEKPLPQTNTIPVKQPNRGNSQPTKTVEIYPCCHIQKNPSMSISVPCLLSPVNRMITVLEIVTGKQSLAFQFISISSTGITYNPMAKSRLIDIPIVEAKERKTPWMDTIPVRQLPGG